MPLHFIRSLLERLSRRERPRKINRRADPLGAFIAERTQPRADALVPSAILFEAYERWARIHGAPLLAPTYLARRLATEGYSRRFAACPSGAARACWQGLALIEEQP